MFVYVLQHFRDLKGNFEDIKFIGVFSDHGAAQQAQKILEKEAGFRDYPGGFSIDRYQIDEIYWRGGFYTD